MINTHMIEEWIQLLYQYINNYYELDLKTAKKKITTKI